MIVGYFRKTDEDDAAAAMAVLRVERCLRVEMDPAGRFDSRRAMILDLDRGDMLVSPSIAHLAVSITDLLKTSRQVHARGATLKLVLEKVDTTVPAARNALAALAGFEAAQVASRRSEGLERAALSGHRPGRPPKLNAATLLRLRTEMEAGRSFAALAEELGVHPTTVMRRLKALEDRREE